MLLPTVGGVGQRAILDATVGLAMDSAAAGVAFAYLAGAGVGTIAVSGDLDGPPTAAEVEGSIVYEHADLGRTRFATLVAYAAARNPDVAVVRDAGRAPRLVVDGRAPTLARAHVDGGGAAARFLADVVARDGGPGTPGGRR